MEQRPPRRTFGPVPLKIRIIRRPQRARVTQYAGPQALGFLRFAPCWPVSGVFRDFWPPCVELYRRDGITPNLGRFVAFVAPLSCARKDLPLTNSPGAVAGAVCSPVLAASGVEVPAGKTPRV